MKFIIAATLALGLGFVGVVGFHHFTHRPEPSSTPAPGQAVAGSGWHHSWESAAAAARATGRPILADFTGSDWCPPCMALKSQVFDSAQFKSWVADKQIILFEVDFPRRKSQDAAIKQTNRDLAQRLNVRSFPTIIMLDADGKPLGGRLNGYGGQGPAGWITQAENTWGGVLGQ